MGHDACGLWCWLFHGKYKGEKPIKIRQKIENLHPNKRKTPFGPYPKTGDDRSLKINTNIYLVPITNVSKYWKDWLTRTKVIVRKPILSSCWTIPSPFKAESLIRTYKSEVCLWNDSFYLNGTDQHSRSYLLKEDTSFRNVFLCQILILFTVTVVTIYNLSVLPNLTQ